VQVHVGPPMKIEYRDIYLKHLGTPPGGDTSRGDVLYRPGSLSEPEHQATFENLAKQAARITAAADMKPLSDKKELTIVSRNLAVVRGDLVDVNTSSAAKAQKSDEQRWDLVILDGDNTIRIPGAGDRMKNKTFDREYRIRLQWSDEKKQYEVKELE